MKRAPAGAGQAIRNISHKVKMIILASSPESFSEQAM